MTELVRLHLSHLAELHSFIEGAVSEEIRTLNEKCETLFKRSQSDRDIGFDPFEDEQYKLSEVFPQNARMAVFISAHSVLETGLKAVCRQTYHAGLSKSPPRKTDFYVQDAFKYLIKDVGISKRTLGTLWNTLERYRLLRNLVVHEDGRLPKVVIRPKDRRLRWFIGREPTLSMDQMRRVKLGEGFCPKYINLIQTLFTTLLDTLPLRRRRS